MRNAALFFVSLLQLQVPIAKAFMTCEGIQGSKECGSVGNWRFYELYTNDESGCRPKGCFSTLFLWYPLIFMDLDCACARDNNEDFVTPGCSIAPVRIPVPNREALLVAVDEYMSTNNPEETTAVSLYGFPMNRWDVSLINDFSGVFSSFRNPVMTEFDYNLSQWDVSNATDMRVMFEGALLFNQPIGNWNVTGVTRMSGMFSEASSFNQDISGWSTGNVNDMSGMFYAASSFDQDLSEWDVSAVTSMSTMFDSAERFNRDIGRWSCGSLERMSDMFYNAKSFNQDLSQWNTSSVQTMSYAFRGASKFNQDLSNWDVHQVRSMNSMFHEASAFNQNLCKWGTHADQLRSSPANIFESSNCKNTSNPASPFVDGPWCDICA